MYQINHLTQTHTMLYTNTIVRVMSLTYQWDRAQVYMVTILSVSHDVHQKWVQVLYQQNIQQSGLW